MQGKQIQYLQQTRHEYISNWVILVQNEGRFKFIYKVDATISITPPQCMNDV